MNRLLCLLLCLAGAAAPARAVDAARLAPGPELVLGANDAAWRPLLAELAGKGALYAPFTERRLFSFRKEAVVLKGEMRFSPEQGLSLHYLGTDEAWMIADDRGLVLRNAQGRSREIPNDAHGASAGAVLLPVLRFDLPALARLFTIRAAGTPAAWRLDFAPREAAMAKSVGAVVVEGTGAAVTHLEFRRSASQRVEIDVGPAQTGVTFTPDELKRYFR